MSHQRPEYTTNVLTTQQWPDHTINIQNPAVLHKITLVSVSAPCQKSTHFNAHFCHLELHVFSQPIPTCMYAPCTDVRENLPAKQPVAGQGRRNKQPPEHRTQCTRVISWLGHTARIGQQQNASAKRNTLPYDKYSKHITYYMLLITEYIHNHRLSLFTFTFCEHSRNTPATTSFVLPQEE